MTDLAKQAAQQFLDGLRNGYELAKALHDANPDPSSGGRLAEIKRAIDEFERSAADRVGLGSRVTPPKRRASFDPVKEAADRAEHRSAEMRVKGRSPL